MSAISDARLGLSLPATRFEVTIDGLANGGKFPATLIDGLALDTEALPAFEGAMKMAKKRKGRTYAHNILIQRPFSGDKTLFTWFRECQQKEPVKRNGSVILKDDNGHEVCRFNFMDAWPMGWRAPQFSVDHSHGVPVETVILDIHDLEMV